MPRRFTPPWTAERIPGGCVVKDATGQRPPTDASRCGCYRSCCTRKLMARSSKHLRRIRANIVFESTLRACRECVPNIRGLAPSRANIRTTTQRSIRVGRVCDRSLPIDETGRCTFGGRTFANLAASRRRSASALPDEAQSSVRASRRLRRLLFQQATPGCDLSDSASPALKAEFHRLKPAP